MSSPATIAAGLLDELGLAEATQHARAGRFAEAEAVLVRVRSRAPASAAQLDLLARIRAQQGDARQAEALWDQAIALDPGHEDYRAGRERVRAAGDRSPRLARAAIATLALALVFGGAGVSVLVLTRTDSSAGARAPTPPTTSLAAPAAPAAAGPGPLLRRLRSTLAMPGLDVRPRAGALEVTFDEGLFASGTVLTDDARGLLARVGLRLKPEAGRAAVEVIGHTDNIAGGAGPFKTGAQLRVARAEAVQAALRARPDLPASMLSNGRGRDARAPYSNTTDMGRRRNRTAVLVITARRPAGGRADAEP